MASYYETYTLTAPVDSRLPDGGGYPVTVYVPTNAANAVPQQLYLTRETDFGPERESVWDGFDFTVNARLRGGLTTQIGTRTGRGAGRHLRRRRRSTTTSNGSRRTSDDIGPDPRGCHNVEPWQTTMRGLASYTIPKIDVLVSASCARSRRCSSLGRRPANTTAQWQVPNSVIIGGARLPAAVLDRDAATRRSRSADNEHRIYSDERRTQMDMRFAKVLRFGRTRADVGVDLNNLLNTNYATRFNTTYIYNTDNTPRPSGWGTPTGIYNPRFVRLNFTVNF